MRLRLKIIQDAHFPAFAHKQISDVRADQARATSDERAFHFVVEAFVSMPVLLRFGAWDKRRYKFIIQIGQIRSRPSRAMISFKNLRVSRAISAGEFSLKSPYHSCRNDAESSTFEPP